MNELQEMQDRIAQLELKSKKQATRQRFVVALALACAVFAAAAQTGYTQTDHQKTLTCSRLQLVDPTNKVVGDIGVNKDGEGYVTLMNGSYKKTVMLGATVDTGEGSIWVYDGDGKNMATIFSKEGAGHVWTQK